MKTRAAVMHEPGALVVEELDVEEPLPGEVVVRMSAVGVCGTDLHSYKGEWDRPTPMVLGHEGAGLVEAVGSEVEGLSEGDRVVLSWAPACGECGPCRRGRPAACGPLSSAIARGTLLGGRTGLSLNGETVFRGTATGALAEHVVVDAAAAMPLGEDVPMEQAALLGCAALTGVGAVLNAARPEPGFTALVIGAGGVGQFVVQGARIAGAAEILVVDPVEGRRAQALALGATRACAPDDVREAVAELDPEGVDYAFDAVGAAATTKLALRWTRGGGTAVVVGLPAGGEKLELDPFEFSNREKTLTGRSTAPRIPASRCRGCSTSSPPVSSSSRAWSGRRSRSSAPTTPFARASRASPAACSCCPSQPSSTTRRASPTIKPWAWLPRRRALACSSATWCSPAGRAARRRHALGPGRLVLVAGEAGVGKSAAVRDFCEARAGLVCSGAAATRCSHRGRSARSSTSPRSSEPGSTAAPPEVVGALLRLPTLPGQATILVLEDVHWADEATLDALRLLARKVGAVALARASDVPRRARSRASASLVLGELATRADVERLSACAALAGCRR